MDHPRNTTLVIGLILAQWSSMAAIAIASDTQVTNQPEGMAEDVLEQARSRFPAAVAALGADCSTPNTLTAVAYGATPDADYVGFYCWAPARDNGSRRGQWLGRLPLRAESDRFVAPYRCSETDDSCAALWPPLLASYPSAISQAEFQCAIKDGTLFLNVQPEQVDLRCGFFATTLWDENGDGTIDYEDPVSVDISVTRLPLP